MTLVTAYLGVLSLETKLGVLVVIEFDLIPFLFSMTIPALGAKAVLMDILDRMAGGTLFWGILVLVLYMAQVAGDLFVRATQFEIGLVMVELFAAPALGAVA